METLDRDDKFYCDRCCCLQEAQKRMLIKEAPQCLILHLKRFKYIETQGRCVWAVRLGLLGGACGDGAGFDEGPGTGPTARTSLCACCTSSFAIRG